MRCNTYNLEELVNIKYGKNQKKIFSKTGTVPIYGTGGLIGYGTQYLYNKPSILIGRKGSIEKIRYVEHPFWTVDTLFYTEINTNLVIPLYLYYKILLIDLSKYNEGTTIPSLRTETLNKLQFEIPNIEDQLKIVSIIRPIDLKIENNQQINHNLEEQAKAIFKSWFIDYEPFGGVMPEDWQFVALDEVAEIGAGGDKPKEISSIKTTQHPYPIYSNGLADNGLYGYTDKATIFDESITVSARGTIGFVCLRQTPYLPIVRLITLRAKTKIITGKYLYLWLKQLHIIGTGTTQQQLTIPDFQKTQILLPPLNIILAYTAIVNALFEKI